MAAKRGGRALQPRPEGVAGTARILIVDDDRDFGDVLRRRLQRALGVPALVLESGTAALEAVRGEDFRLILTDYRMPRMDGIEFLSAAHRLRPSVPAIMVTSEPEPGLGLRAQREAGVAAVLSKSAPWADLIEVVRCNLRS